MVAENSKIMANNFEGLNQSCVVNIGFAGENKTLSAEELENCAKLLKEKGIDTVLYNTPEAQDSSKTVLTPTGIQSPVLSAEDAKNFTNDVYESINDTYNLAYAYPELGEQMASNSAPELSQEDQDFRNEFVKDKTYDAGLYPTDAYCFDTRAEYEQYKENYQNGNGQMITDTDRLQDAFMKRRNLQNSAKSALTLDDNTIYRGSSVADAYAITSNVENKKCVYATVSAYEALSYTNNSFIPGASGYSGNSVEVNGERIGVGFFHQYEKSQDGQRFYRDYGMENGAEQLNEHQANHTKSETPVFPHKNKLKDSYIALGSHLESYLVKVYENDPRWQKFKELSQVSSPEINDYMSKRKDVQKNELKSNPNYAAKYKLDAENAVEQEEIKEVENVAPTKKKSTLGRWGDKLLNLVKKEADKARKDLKDIAKEVKTEFKATGTEFKELFLMFSLPEHLTNLVSKYCDEMDAKDKDYLISRMRKEKNNPKEVYDLGDLEWFPTDEEREQKAPKECQDEKKIATVNKILEDFKNGNSKINKDLKEILGNVDLVIAIRPPDQWKNPNGGMVFKRGENGENDKAVLFVADVMFTEAHKDKLPGLLAHEMGHLLEFKQRPNDDSVKTKYMDGAESFADVSGEMIARNAGHTSMPWAMFMRQSSKNGNDPEHSPSGQYRAKTIMRTIRAFNKTESKKKQNISERISSLRNRISKCDTKAPNKTNQNISKVDFSTLKMYQEKKTNS